MPREKSKRQKALFRVKCPLGYTISLDLVCWNKHILKNHPIDMPGRESDVKLTITAPNEVRRRALRDRTNLIYWKTFEREREKFNRYLRVVTKVVGSKEAVVVTAHPDNHIYGGRKIWPR